MAQDDHSFWLEREVLAAAGWNVLQMNYRGSSGRGEAHQRAIYADWCGKEVEDLLGAVDQAVRSGIADSARLAVGGWSYGGILTDYTHRDHRPSSRRAVSGAEGSLFTSMFGSDQYAAQYLAELGAPWKDPALWQKLSYAFWRAERISTPTLFMGGADDFNVPIAGSEQMYLALRSLRLFQLVYPDQFHGLTVPSYQRDRLQRYLAWWGKYLQPGTPTPPAVTAAPAAPAL